MLKGLFKKKSKPQYVPFPVKEMQVDMHNHLLFGIDDGARVEQDSLNMLNAYQELGFKKVFASPHVMSDDYRNNPDTILPVLDRVKEIASENNINLELGATAEYYLDDGFADKLESGEMLPFGDDYLLFETSMQFKPGNLKEMIFEMSLKGLLPVYAHPERYFFMHGNSISQYEDLYATGVKFQLNLLSFMGQYGPEVKRVAEQLVEADMVDFVGTDAHHVKHLKMLSQLTVPEKLAQMVSDKKLLNSSLI